MLKSGFHPVSCIAPLLKSTNSTLVYAKVIDKVKKNDLEIRHCLVSTEHIKMKILGLDRAVPCPTLFISIYQFLFVIFTGVQITGLQQLTISISISALSDGQAPLAGTVYLNLYFPTGKLFVLQVVPV